jgi:cell wall-associated NlpC family hydrolase
MFQFRTRVPFRLLMNILLLFSRASETVTHFPIYCDRGHWIEAVEHLTVWWARSTGFHAARHGETNDHAMNALCHFLGRIRPQANGVSHVSQEQRHSRHVSLTEQVQRHRTD